MIAGRSLPLIHAPRVPAAAEAAPELALVRDLALVEDLTAVRDSRRVMALLAAGVPLSLLCDLADPDGPPSADIASCEDPCSVLGDLMTFRAASAEGNGAGARVRTSLRELHLG